jgi:hypothetical protein
MLESRNVRVIQITDFDPFRLLKTGKGSQMSEITMKGYSRISFVRHPTQIPVNVGAQRRRLVSAKADGPRPKFI